jgi:hypothetical protein
MERSVHGVLLVRHPGAEHVPCLRSGIHAAARTG